MFSSVDPPFLVDRDPPFLVATGTRFCGLTSSLFLGKNFTHTPLTKIPLKNPRFFFSGTLSLRALLVLRFFASDLFLFLSPFQKHKQISKSIFVRPLLRLGEWLLFLRVRVEGLLRFGLFFRRLRDRCFRRLRDLRLGPIFLSFSATKIAHKTMSWGSYVHMKTQLLRLEIFGKKIGFGQECFWKLLEIRNLETAR